MFALDGREDDHAKVVSTREAKSVMLEGGDGGQVVACSVAFCLEAGRDVSRADKTKPGRPSAWLGLSSLKNLKPVGRAVVRLPLAMT